MNGEALQAAVYNELSAPMASMSPAVGVYDHLPQHKSYPFIVIGDDTLNSWDTDDSTGIDATLQIHVWSTYRGKKQCKQIATVIYDVLHRSELVVEGYETVLMDHEQTLVLEDPDGKTWHGIVRFRYVGDSEST